MPVLHLTTAVDDDFELSSGRLSLNPNGYVLVDGRTLLHRLIVGAEANEVIDHIDGNRLNNQRSNLRSTTHQGNAQNLQGAQKNNRLGLRGVWQCRKTGRFRAAATVNGKKQYAGYFATAEEAAQAAAQLRRSLGFLGS
ncbi:MAG: HNH endonuclease [Phycisphaerales bacterium]